MNGSHSGNGTVKSEVRKQNRKSYQSSGRRERNRDRRLARILKGLRGPHKIVQNGQVYEIRRGAA